MESTLETNDSDPFIVSHKEEVEHRRGVKEQLEEFCYTIGNEEADWVRSARVTFLKDKINELKEEKIGHKVIELQCRGQIYQWFGDMIREEYMAPLDKKIKKHNAELDLWSNPVRPAEGSLTDDQIQAAREADCADFIDIARHDGQRNWALCPFHGEKTPSFCCYPPPKGYNCFGCQKNGNAIDLVMELDKLSFQDAVRKILKII